MSGPIISWSPISDSYNTSAQYVNDGRYKLLSPSSIVGTPTLALQNAFQACTVKTYLGSPSVLNTTLTVPVSGTNAILHSSGRALTVAELQTLVIEAEGVELNETLFATDEPNGSLTNPFPTEAARNAAYASQLPGAVGWPAYVGSPAILTKWIGPDADDWVFETPPANVGDIAVIGNSIMELNGARFVQGIPESFSSRGFVVLAAILSGGRARLIENWGIGGQKSIDILNRIAQVTRSKAGTIVVLEATNDNTGSVLASTVIPNYQAIADAIISSGKQCIMCTGIPRGTASANQLQFYSDLNAWIMSYNPSPLYRPCDIATPIRDAGGLAIANALADGIHPSSFGASKMAPPLAAIFNSTMPKRNLTERLMSTERNLLTNPLFSGSGTSAPTSWNVQNAPASWAYVAAPEINATRTTVPVATVNPGGQMILTQNVAVASLPIGFRAKASVRLKAENLDPAPAANTQNIQAYFQYYNGSTFTGSARADYWDGGANYKNCPLEGELELVTVSGVIPAGTTLTQLVVQCVGGGTYTLLEAFLGTDPGPEY